jgi:hypothetical protein
MPSIGLANNDLTGKSSIHKRKMEQNCPIGLEKFFLNKQIEFKDIIISFRGWESTKEGHLLSFILAHGKATNFR